MGGPIRKTATRDDILRDIKKTQINAIARGGVAADLAALRIAPVILIIDSLTLQMQAASFVAAPLLAALAAADARADKTVGKVSDDIWNYVGRPASARPARAKLHLLERVLSAVARSAGIELVNYKRMLKAHGFPEAAAHSIIPDRGAAPVKKDAAAAKKEVAPVVPAVVATPGEPPVVPAGEGQGKG